MSRFTLILSSYCGSANLRPLILLPVRMQRSGKILAILSLPSTLPHMVQSSFRWRAIVFFDSSSVSLPPFCGCFWLFSNAFMYSQSFYLWFFIWDLTYSLQFISNSEISTLQFQRCLQSSRNYSLGPMVLATNKQAIFSLFCCCCKIYLFQREHAHTSRRSKGREYCK